KMKFILPKLQEGDSIGLVATARKVSKEEMQPFKNWVAQNGWKLIEGMNLYNADRQFAGTDRERASDLNDMLNNPEVKALVCARGGCRTVRTVAHVEFTPLTSQPKWLCGLSDVTVLHQYLFQNFDSFPSRHSMRAISFSQYEEKEWGEPAEVLAGILKRASV